MNIWRVLVAAWMGLIFAVSAWPGAARSETADYLGSENDLVRLGAHFAEFGILALLWAKALPGSGRPASWRIRGLAMALTLLYALSDEVHQMYVPGRLLELAATLLVFVIAVLLRQVRDELRGGRSS